MVTCALAWAVTTCDARADEPAASPSGAGIRQLTSKHLTLFTDLPSDPEVDALPALFDQAFAQWCTYFGVDESQHADWIVRACLMKSRPPFEAAGLVPAEIPQLVAGYSRGTDIWLLEQPSAYYRRHLLLHEGTHVFMDTLAGGKGPPWYSEAMAELLATHRLDDGRLTLNYFPANREVVPKWGRIEIGQAAFVERHALSLELIFDFDARASLSNQSYGWCWAAAAFFEHQPRYQSRFRALHNVAAAHDFSEQFMQTFAADWPRIRDEWQLYVANLDYAYDFKRMRVELAPGKPLATNAKVEIAADRGWQTSGVQLEAGKKYRLRATGRYQVAREPRVWWCEPGGVTIRYYRGQPLGILMAGIHSDDPHATGAGGLLKPIVVGLETTLTPAQTGTLYLRINDSAGSLSDNSGVVTVEIAAE